MKGSGLAGLAIVAAYTSSSLTLRAVLKSAAGRLGMGAPAARVSGLTPSAKAMCAAAAASRGRTLVVAASDADVDTLTADARFFLSALEGLSDAEVERAVLPFPSHEIDPYRGLAPHFDIASARARALHGVAAGDARLVIASAAALLPRVSTPDRLAGVSMTLTPGQEISPVDLGDLLASAGYVRQDPVDESGEFCVRGGVVDFYPAGADEPIRLEFVGDTIESIRAYDPATQRSTTSLDQASIEPLQELLGEGDDPDRSATVFDYLWAGGRPTVIVSEPDEVRAQGEKLTAQIQASHDEAVAKGLKVPPPSALVISWEEASAWLDGASALETLSIGPSTGSGQGPVAAGVHIACQPAIEFAGRVPEWVAEIRRGRERGDTIVFLANSPGRAERTIEMLRDYDIFAAPIEQAEDVRTASVLVGVGRLSRGFRLPDAALQLFAETDVFEEDRKSHERRRQSAARTFLADFRDLKVGDLVVHIDHGIGVFVGLKRIDVGLAPQEFMELHYAGDDKLFVPVERLDLGAALQRVGAADARQAGRDDVGKSQDARQESDARHGRGAVEALCRAQGDARSRLQPGHALAAGVRGLLRVGPHGRSEERHRRHQARHGGANHHGSPALRRCRVRQDGSGHARRVQGGDGRQAGGVPCADHRARLPARQDAPHALCGLSGADRHGQPLPDERGTEGVARRSHRRQGGHHRRHPPAALEGRQVPRSRSARRRRGAALRRRAQGTHQADAQARGRPHHERDTHPAHAEHVARRHSRHVHHRDAAEGPPLDPDQRRQVRRRRDPACDPDGDGARRPGLRGAQPRRVDLLARRTSSRGSCPRRAS